MSLDAGLGEWTPNDHLVNRIVMALSKCGECDDGPRGTKLDSHANMTVVGSQAFVFSTSGKTCNVQAFSKEAAGMNGVHIVDAVIAYDCQFSGWTFILVFRNALYVPSMGHNLIPPFIMRESGLEVNECTKIHCDDPTVADHSIYDPETDLRSPLSLNGVFSVFKTRCLTEGEIED